MRKDLEIKKRLSWVFPMLIAWAASAGANAPAGLPSEIDLERLTLVHWTTEDGLPSNALTNVLQTSEGFIWIATYNGLVRFDGRSFTTFGKGSRQPLPANGFHELEEDTEGTLWIGTQGGGLLTYRDGRFRVFKGDYGRRSTIRSLLISDEDLLWVGVSDYGVYQHRDGRVTLLEHPSVIGSTVRDILRDRTGALWIAAEGKGLVHFHEGVFRTYTTRSGLSSDAVSSLYESAQGELYVGSLEGLDKLADGEVSSFPEVRGIEVNRIYGDARGNLWLATMQGLYRRRAGAASFEHLTELRGQALGSVTALAFDHEGSIWLASGSHGLFQLKRSHFRNYSTEQGLSTLRVNVAREIKPGEVWAGADNGTINVIRNGEVSTLDFASLHSDLRVRDIHRDRQGTMWITSYAGLLHLSGDGEVLYTTRDGLPTNQLRSLYEDGRGRLWIGTQNAGLVRMSESGRFETLDTSTGLASNFIFSIDEDLEGNLVLGTRGALTLLDADGQLSHYSAEHGLTGSIVFNTSTDRDGSIWLCTNDGLARFRDGRIRTLTDADGLPSESVFDFAEDSRGFVWLSSAHGVVRLAKAQLIDFMEGRAERVEATLLDESDGMVSRDCTGATKFLEARDGTLWFPTLGGLAVTDPEDQPRNEIEPRVVISRFLVDGAPVDSLDLGPGKKRFDFQFAALSFLAPDKVQVRFRLEGFDEDWRVPDGDYRASYTSLHPRRYTFRVIASNNDGVWNEEGATLRFRLRPFFYQRPVFYAAVAAFLALALYRLYRWRLRVVSQRNLELERRVAELERAQAER
jgi:ligand-binding sensor domain-containing protein